MVSISNATSQATTQKSKTPATNSSSTLSTANKAHENFMLHLLTTQHTDSINLTTVGDHLVHHIGQETLLSYFKDNPNDFKSLSNYKNLANSAPDFVKTQAGMSSEAQWFMHNLPQGVSQNALEKKLDVSGAAEKITGFSAKQILDVEQASMKDANAGITAQGLMDTWVHVTGGSDKNGVTLDALKEHVQHHSHQSDIFGALAADTNITDPLLKETATKYTGKNAAMAKDAQWVTDHFNDIAKLDGKNDSISVKDMQTYLVQNATPKNGSFEFAPPTPTPPPFPPPTTPPSSEWIQQLITYLKQLLGVN